MRFWYNDNIRKYPFNPDNSRALFREMGFRYEDGVLYDTEERPVEFSDN